MVAAVLWDVLAKAANIAQLSGVQAVSLLAGALSFLRIPECMQERAELERCACRLRALLQERRLAIASGYEIVTRHPEMEGLVRRILDDVDDLVGSYDGSTFWRRLRTGRTMIGQLRDMHDRVDSCCVLVLFAHAYVLTQAIIPPLSDAATSRHGNVGTQTDVETCATANPHQMPNDIGQEGLDGQTDDTDPGCEIVIAT